MRYKNYRPRSLGIFIVFLTIFMILFLGCPQPDMTKKGKGLEETPAMLYKSFRASSPGANGGAAPELAKDVDLSPFFPKPGDQGMIGSCTGWSIAYACKSYHENIERNWGVNTNEHIFSPSFIYNQINGGSDGGAPIEAAIAVVIQKGCASLSTMPYTENLQTQPNQNAFNEAIQFKAKSFAKVDYNNLEAVKEVLARGNPVIIGMMIYENFYDYKGGVLTSSSGALLGGHAMCVLGYDDGKKAFKIINSWSTYWGEGGYGWIGYDLFKKEVKVCVVIYDDVAASPKEAAIPVNIEASRGSFADKIEVTWEKAKHATSYKVSRSIEANQNFKEVANTKGTKFIDSEGIKPGVIYYYAVKSVNENGESEFSESAKGFAGSLEQEIGIPQKFEGLFSEGAVYLTWQKIENVDGYYVYAFDNEKKNFLRLGSTKNINFKDSRSFKNGETLWYIVTAFKGQKESKPSPSISITVVIEEKPEYKPLKAPRHIKASEGEYEDKIIISWDAVQGAESYNLYKWNHKEEKWFSYQEVKELSYTDTQLSNPFEYYAVVAKNQYVKSEPSDLAYGYIKEHKKEIKKEEVVYDDQEYYDDKEFEDTDYTDEKLYDDDKVYQDEQKKTYNGFFEDTSVIEEKWKKEEEEFFDTEEEKEKFFDSEKEKEQFFESEEEKEKFFDSQEEEDKFFDSDEKPKDKNKKEDKFFDSEEENDKFFE
jgi:fibronectin type 3 domain-containing protein